MAKIVCLKALGGGGGDAANLSLEFSLLSKSFGSFQKPALLKKKSLLSSSMVFDVTVLEISRGHFTKALLVDRWYWKEHLHKEMAIYYS